MTSVLSKNAREKSEKASKGSFASKKINPFCWSGLHFYVDVASLLAYPVKEFADWIISC